MEKKEPQLNFHEKQEPVWVVQQTDSGNHGIVGVAVAEAGTAQLPGIDKSRPFTSTKVILYRPSLAPIYGGPTLLEALWNEMDRLMEALMTGEEADDSCRKRGCFPIGPDAEGEPETECGHPDNGNRYRAEELAWVLAIVSNAYDPSVDRIREEALSRWNASQGVGE